MRAHIDRKYLLGLALTDPGFYALILSGFRSPFVVGGVETLLFDTLLNLCRERGRQRTAATHVLRAVRSLNRLGCAIETLRATPNGLAIAAPDWLSAHTTPTWIERYGRSMDDFYIPQGETARRAYVEEVGSDGHRLLVAIDAQTAPGWLRDVPAVAVLHRVWLQNFRLSERDPNGLHGGDRVQWRTDANGIPPTLPMVASPYDTDIDDAKKHTTT